MIIMFRSLSGRFLFASALLLPVFLGLTGAFLERAFANSLYESEVERLKVQIYLLLGAAEVIDGELYVPEHLQEPKYSQLNSGLYGIITDQDLTPLWLSSSSQLMQLDIPRIVGTSWEAGQGDFGELMLDGKSGVESSIFYYRYPVIWEVAEGIEVPLMFVVLSSQNAFQAMLVQYRAYLLVWLGGVGIFLLIAQAIIMRWGLRPLKKLAGDLKAIEEGKDDHLSGQYPKEVENVTENLNQLLDSERQQRERFRNTLGDLAHSLKTPLAVIRSSAPEKSSAYVDLVLDQVSRMDQIVGHQLQRAQSRSHHSLVKPILVKPVADRLTSALSKVYKNKSVVIQVELDESIQCRVDEGDLLEVLGNVLDNACKCCQQQVSLSASLKSSEGESQGSFVTFHIGDDGPGIPENERRFVLERGARADTVNAGQGIGLAVVVDIISSYGGGVDISEAALGGAEFSLTLPC